MIHLSSSEQTRKAVLLPASFAGEEKEAERIWLSYCLRHCAGASDRPLSPLFESLRHSLTLTRVLLLLGFRKRAQVSFRLTFF